MQRSFVFLATADPAFEARAIDAILESRHGVRRARDLDEAYATLSAGATGVALAVVDTTGRQFGRELLLALNGAKTDFPVLAITDRNSPMDWEKLDGLAMTQIDKTSDTEILRDEIRERCAEAVCCLC